MIERDAVIAGRYRLVRRIGVGGMGSVWEARDESLQRTVALKLLHPRPGVSEAEAQVAKDRAMREARITARLHHAHAVPVFDVVEHEGQPCLIMQYLPSRSLQDALREKGTLPADEVALVGAEVASALAAAHAAGIVHRDVKPANILLTEDGAAKITDFGISHALGDATLTSAGMVSGTPAYLAPEVARGDESSFASDVFSLGATLYTAIEGMPPFGTHENAIALLHRVASEPIVPPQQATALTPVLLAMLAGRPEERPTMAQVARTLETLDLDTPTPDSATAVLPAAAPPPAEVPAQASQPAMAVAPTASLPAAAPTGLAASPGPAPERPSPGDDEPGRRSRAGLVLLVLALLVGVAAVFAIQNLRSDDPVTAQPPVTTSSPVATTTTTTTPVPTTSEAPATSSSPTPAPTTTTSTPPPAPQGPTAEQLEAAITDYYALLPDDTKTGYSLLTDRFRREKAGSLDSYEGFWDDLAQVAATDAAGTPPGTVEATITYRFESGRVIVERTAYTLVEEGGVLKIDSSKVLRRL